MECYLVHCNVKVLLLIRYDYDKGEQLRAMLDFVSNENSLVEILIKILGFLECLDNEKKYVNSNLTLP